MSEIKLKSCPFCGGEACTYQEGKNYGVMCKSTAFCSILTAGYLSEEEAMAHWNTRKPMERIVERLEEQTDECIECKSFAKNTKYYDGAVEGLRRSIKIVKKESGI